MEWYRKVNPFIRGGKIQAGDITQLVDKNVSLVQKITQHLIEFEVKVCTLAQFCKKKSKCLFLFFDFLLLQFFERER